ncbi:hypothetical protein FOA52_007431 [Chlamydomonas sp. UWO 241]|nr:hypothetical protein FOA52_007431 [Chlamydomonas sp. UWO 241]
MQSLALCHSASPAISAAPRRAATGVVSHRAVRVRNNEIDGVANLLARDKKLSGAINVVPELSDDPSEAPGFSGSVSTPTDSGVLKSRKKRQETMAKNAEKRTDPNRPKTCKGAIDRGLQLFVEKRHQDAIDMFNMALELPGNGAYRMPDSPREYSCPSDAEENAALYNMACAYAAMGRKEAAIACLEGVLDNGFSDFETLRNDPDLASVRGNELEFLMLRYQNPVGKGINGIFKMGQQQKESSPDGKRPWFLW